MGGNKRAIRLCVRCGESRPHAAKGLCRSCYSADYNRSPAGRDSRSRYNQTHPEVVSSYRWPGQAQHRAAHKEELRAYNRQYHATHQEEEKAYREAHPEQLRATKSRYKKRHPEQAVLDESRRRARKRNLLNDLTGAQWTAIQAAYNGGCAYCGVKMKRLEPDHVIPVVKDGPTTTSNIVPACRRCNGVKGDRPPATVPAVRLLL